MYWVLKIGYNFFNDNTNKKNIYIYLIENKKDLENDVEDDMVELFLEENKSIEYRKTSAKIEDNHII